MATIKKSAKQLQIDKTNSAIVIIVSVAAIVIAFSGVSIKSMLAQRAYQSKVINEQKKALVVAKADVTAVNDIGAAYKAFDEAALNIIGGSTSGVGPQDGTSSKIVLDALPSKYDFPAIVSSLTNLLQTNGYKSDSLSATNGGDVADTATGNPVPTEIPFQYSTTGDYTSIKNLVSVFDRSIRPIALNTMQISGSDASLSISMSAKTYYQPAKVLNISTKVVK